MPSLNSSLSIKYAKFSTMESIKPVLLFHQHNLITVISTTNHPTHQQNPIGQRNTYTLTLHPTPHKKPPNRKKNHHIPRKKKKRRSHATSPRGA